MAKQNAAAPSVSETGNPCRDDVADRMIAVFHGRPEIAVEDAAEIAAVLLQHRLVQVVFGAEMALDFRRGGFALAVKRPARHGVDQQEGQEADQEQQRDHE